MPRGEGGMVWHGDSAALDKGRKGDQVWAPATHGPADRVQRNPARQGPSKLMNI